MRITVWTKSLPILELEKIEFDFQDLWLIIRVLTEKKTYYVPFSDIQSFIIEAEEGD